MKFAMRTTFLGACLTTALFFSPMAHALDVAGLKVPDTALVGSQALKINGAGIRYKVFFKVYTAALYLTDTKTSAAEVLANTGPKRLTLHIMRDLSSEELGRRFMDGIKKNADVNERTKIVDAMLVFGQMFSSIPEMKKGDVLSVDLVPGVGVISLLNGKKTGETITNTSFYNSLLKIWLGNAPVDERLKRNLLGERVEDMTDNRQ